MVSGYLAGSLTGLGIANIVPYLHQFCLFSKKYGYITKSYFMHVYDNH